MHIVFLNQYYPPDAAPTGVVLQDVAEELVRRGHEITVICGFGGYADAANRQALPTPNTPQLRVMRIRATRFGRGTFLGKLVDYATYYLGSAWSLLRLDPRPERVVALTTPPYLSVLARVLSKLRGADHAHWVMDLYPDVMQAYGMLNGQGVIYRALGWLTRWGFGGKRCAAVLALGPDMAARTGRHVRDRVVDWVPLWATASQGEPHGVARSVAALRRDRGWADDDLVVMYSGNMGLGHRFAELLQAVRTWRQRHPGGDHPHLRFVFFGGGKRRGEIESFARDNPDCGIELYDYAPTAILDTHLRSADVHLVSLDPAWIGTMVPSKLQGIFAAGRPVVFVGPAESSIGQWVRESGGGWCVDPHDVPALLDAFAALQDHAECTKRGVNAWNFAARHFDPAMNIARVAEVLTRRFSETSV